jgi:hypothetical protein
VGFLGLFRQRQDDVGREILAMRKLLILGLVSAATLVPCHGEAYEGPWCAVISEGAGGVAEICSMPSFEICRDFALRFGPTSFCRQNPAYPGYWSKEKRRPHPLHRKKRHRRH